MNTDDPQGKIRLTKHTIDTAPPVSKEILLNSETNFGFIPNMFTLMANNPSLLDSYNHGYNSFRANSGFSPDEQEVIFLSASYENECHYCVPAHSFMADEVSGVPKKVIELIRNGIDHDQDENRLMELSRFTRSVVKNRGAVPENDIKLFFEVGFDEKAIAGVIAGVGVKTMSNYFNKIVQTPLDAMFANRKWSPK